MKVENLVFSGEKNKYILKKKVPKNTNTVKKQKKRLLDRKKKTSKKNIAKISTHDAEKISHFLENIVKSLPKKIHFLPKQIQITNILY